MNGSRAKLIRREVYGDRASNPRSRSYQRLMSGQLLADERRRLYQKRKRYYWESRRRLEKAFRVRRSTVRLWRKAWAMEYLR